MNKRVSTFIPYKRLRCGLLRISERSVHNLLYSSELEGVLYKRRWKFTEEEVQAYLKKQIRAEGQKGAHKKRAYVKRKGQEKA